jgi:hypothetical protein
MTEEGTDRSYYTDRAEQCFQFLPVPRHGGKRGDGVESSATTIYEEGNTWQQPKPLSGGA